MATLDEMAADIAKQKRVTAAIADLKGGDKSTQPGLLGTLQSAAEQVALVPEAKGLLRAGAGVGQFLMDQLGSFSPTLEKAADAVSGHIKEGLGGLEKVSPTTSPVGEALGEMIPTMAVAPTSLVGGALAGAATGASRLRSEPTVDERQEGRGMDALLGAGIGGVAAPVSTLVGKIANSRAVRDTLNKIKDNYEELDPAITKARGTLNQLVDRLMDRHRDLSTAALRSGDAQGNILFNDIGPKLKELTDSPKTMLAPDRRATAILDRVQKTLIPEQKLPDDLKFGAVTYSRDAGNRYVSKNGQVLHQKIVDAYLKDQGVQLAPDIKYSQVRSAIDEMDDYLGKTRVPKNPAAVAVKDARALLQKKLDDFETPSTQALRTKATRFYDKNVAQYDDPVIKDLLAETDPLARANKALEVALGRDPKKAEVVAKLVGNKGQEAVRQGMIKKGLDAAYDQRTDTLDGMRFVRFFEDKPGYGPFQNAESDRIIKGVKNFLDQDKLARPVSGAEPSLGHPGALWGWLTAAHQLIHGNIPGAVVAASTPYIVRGSFRTIRRMMGDAFGRHLLKVASTAVPGSNRMAQISQQAMRRFGPAAAQQAGRLDDDDMQTGLSPAR